MTAQMCACVVCVEAKEEAGAVCAYRDVRID